MVTNLLFKSVFDVEVYKSKFTLNNEINSTKEIPFLRFNLDNYDENAVAYIKGMLDKFEYSVGICEFSLRDTLLSELDTLGELEDTVAKILHIRVTNDDVANGGISEHDIELLNTLSNSVHKMDRVVLHDNSTVLNPVMISLMKKQICNTLGLKGENSVGLCGSPFSFDGSSCLTAEVARDLISIYGYNRDVKIPSANHQSMDSCSCIRHFEVVEDTPYTGKKAKKDSVNVFDGLDELVDSVSEPKEKKEKKGNTKKKENRVKKKVSKAPIEWV